jgi:uncharacterized protein (TIGR00251 family)
MALKIWVTVKPRSKREEIKKTAGGEYVVAVRAPAREGKANQALLQLLAAHFRIPKSALKIVQGGASRRKLIRLDADPHRPGSTGSDSP